MKYETQLQLWEEWEERLRAQKRLLLPEKMEQKEADRKKYEKLPQNILSKLNFISSGCIEWTRGKSRNGYGSAWHNGTNNRAHRLVYEIIVGKIPQGLELDHLCRNRPCVNVDHLEPVTHTENNRRGLKYQILKMSCPHGHEYSFENTYFNPIKKQRGCVVCRTIKREYFDKGLKNWIEEAKLTTVKNFFKCKND